MADDSPTLPDDINPGVKRLVHWLNSLGLRTVDSGDGQTHDHECDRPDPYVVIMSEPHALVPTSLALRDMIEDLGIEVSPQGQGRVYIQANFDPVDGYAFIDLNGMTDADLHFDGDSFLEHDDESDSENLYVVRLYDGMDGVWIDITEPVSHSEARRVWRRFTKEGTKNTSYGDLDYYKIFPANTKMKYDNKNPMNRD